MRSPARYFLYGGICYYFPRFSGTILTMGGSPGDVSEEPVTQEKRKKGWRMSCGVREATEGLENEL